MVDLETRKSFSFFISYWEAIEELPEKEQLPVLKAIIKYAFFDEEPTHFKGIKRAVFLLVKPTLDKSKQKSANGKRGGSKSKANGKQTPSDISEGEGEGIGVGKGEGIGEGEGDNHPRSDGSLFTSFWNAYPWKINREEAWEAWKSLNPDFETVIKIMTGLEAWKKSDRWTEDGGRYVPSAAKFLREREAYWGNPPQPAQKKGQQGYVHGADRLMQMLERGDFDD